MDIDIMELARILKDVEIKCVVYGCEDCKYRNYFDIGGRVCSATAIVDELKKQRYVKLAENEIVITKEDYEELKSRPDRAIHIDITKDFEKNFRGELEQASKDVARRILQTLTGILKVAGKINKNHLLAIAKDFSVENEIGVEV